MTILCLFYRFLKYNNLFYIFMHNIMINDSITFKYEINEQKSNVLISNAFDWTATKEGYYFWCDIDDMWREIIYQFNINKLTANNKIDNEKKYEIIEFFIK